MIVQFVKELTRIAVNKCGRLINLDFNSCSVLLVVREIADFKSAENLCFNNTLRLGA